MDTKFWKKFFIVLIMIYFALPLFVRVLRIRSFYDIELLLGGFLSATLLIPLIALGFSLFVSKKLSEKLYTKKWYVVAVTLCVYLVTAFVIAFGSSLLFNAGAPRIFRVEGIMFTSISIFFIIIIIPIISISLWARVRKNSYRELNQPHL